MSQFEPLPDPQPEPEPEPLEHDGQELPASALAGDAHDEDSPERASASEPETAATLNGGPAAVPARTFTVGEKVASLVEQLLERPPPDARAASALRWINRARRWGGDGMVRQLFPPLEDEEAWHTMLAVFVGVGLELCSDGFELDVREARQAARFVLANLYAG